MSGAPQLKAKTDTIYPLIRLPKTYVAEIGKTAEIFETKHNAEHALFITFATGPEPSEVIQPLVEVIQPEPKVIQLDCQKDVEERLLELESEINE